MDANNMKLLASLTSEDLRILSAVVGTLIGSSEGKQPSSDHEAANKPSARAEESYENLNQNLHETYHLAEKARHASLAMTDKFSSVCGNMFKISRMIPTYMSQIEQEQPMHETVAGQVSLMVLAQVQKASEDLEAFLSSCEDMRLDIERNLDKISLVSRPSGPKSLSVGHALDKWKVGRRVHELCHTWLSGPTSCNVVGGQNEEQAERTTRIKLTRRLSENDSQATDAKREEETNNWKDLNKLQERATQEAKAQMTMGMVVGIFELVKNQLRVELVGKHEELKKREEALNMREEVVKKLENRLRSEEVKKPERLMQLDSEAGSCELITMEPETMSPLQHESVRRAEGRSRTEPPPEANFSPKFAFDSIARRHTK